MKKLALHWQILLGMLLGVIFALIMVNFDFGKEFIKDWIKPFGTIFINSLKLIAIPLILASLVKGISDLKDISKLSQMGGITIVTYLITTVIAVFIGSILMFGAFYTGVNLNDFQGNESNLIVNAKEFDVSDYRMTFFYTTFPFLISISIFILLYKLKEVSNKLIKIVIFIGIILLCLFLIASGNKTSMASVIVVFIISMIYYNRSFFSYLKRISFVIFTFFILTSLFTFFA